MPRYPAVAEIQLDHIATCLTLAPPLLKEVNDAFGPPFVQSITNTIETLINFVQNIKQNKSQCAHLMENIHEILLAIVNLYVKSETAGSVPLVILDNIGKFMETLHKIYTFIEMQQEGNKIKQLLQNNETKKLLKEWQEGLAQAKEFFGIQTQAQTLSDIRHFKDTADVMHKKLIELIETLSDSVTMSERSSPKIFHGGEQELDHILKLTGQKSSRIAILGGGGMGKTSLARAVLHHPETSSHFEHRFFVSAEAATTSIELAALIGLHVGLNPGKDLTKPVVQYFSRKTSCLLIPDNLETVWEPIQSRAEVEEFLSLLTGLEHLALMITMRGAERPAKVQWTHPFLLPLQPLSNDAARQTFIEITGNSCTMEEIDQLVRFTTNMPLAVDLIAHLADYEGVSNILAHWETEKTSLLSVGFDQHSSFDASINLSLSSPRTTSHSKELLSLLSILSNGLSEAELVQGNLGIPNILSCKAALLATSLAHRDSSQCLVLLIPIREYIQQILPPSKSRLEPIHKDFCSIMELFAEHRGEQWPNLVKQTTLNLANLQAILQWGLHPHALSLANTIQCLLDVCLLSQLCDPRLATVLLTELLYTAYYSRGVSDEMIAQVVIDLNDINDLTVAARFYCAAGFHFFEKADLYQATQFVQKALEMAELCGNRREQCNAWIILGIFQLRTSNFGVGNVHATAAQKLSKLSGDLYQEAYAIYLRVRCSISRTDYQGSAAQLHRAIELLHACGMPGGMLAHDIRGIQADIHFRRLEYAEARNIHCEIRETTSAEENINAYSHALFSIGLIDIIIGGPEKEIYHSLKLAQSIFRERRDARRVIMCDLLQALIEFQEKKFDSAKVKFQECLHLFWKKAKAPEYEFLCFQKLANIEVWPVHKQQHKWPMMDLGYAYKYQYKSGLHEALLFLGDVFIADKDENTAATLYQVALEGFTEMNVHHRGAQCMLRLGDLANKKGCTLEAITFWKAARPLFERSVAKDVSQIDSRLATFENAHQKGLRKLETLHAPLQLAKEESSESNTGGKDRRI
ncbi:hypothetical protein K438DRAFT_1777586 [Mycena galopus ATCC 62051]|nr:hypothetical protein K438DRAFT_1777586 [Mycena galopus ATCC 62051]